MVVVLEVGVVMLKAGAVLMVQGEEWKVSRVLLVVPKEATRVQSLERRLPLTHQ